MRLKESLKRTVTVKPAAAPAVYQANDRLYRFDDGQAFAVRAVIQPITEQSTAAVYGETPQAQLLMLCDGGEDLAEGMGVCVDGIETMPCDYRIAAMPRRYTSHKEYTLAYIAPELRG
ncbi:MAG TPA: hypothetical protein PK537_00480 [Candidatus Limiplasma sp.]|nr:hypothetical protein [Candidatus Limiplasma sp.]